MLVTEIESTDNMSNDNNAIGGLRALHRADQVIAVARRFQRHYRQTLILTAADSDAGGLQVVSPPPLNEDGKVGSVNFPTGNDTVQISVPADGI